jgi:Dyp-type peroxidase family
LNLTAATQEENVMRPNTQSTQIGGIASLALLAPVKPGFVEAFETVTYVRRLDMLLRTLNAMRLASRESALTKSPFPDSVGRFGILHSFRYAIVPPGIGSAGESLSRASNPRPGLHRLSLNVTFDGGWETYMRVIYRDLGALLDAIFCNCQGYRASRSHSFDEYTRWVREHEIASGLFYTEASMTVMDQRYLERVERIHRESEEPGAAAAQSAGFALPQTPSLPEALAAFNAVHPAIQAGTLRLNLRALKALHDLRPLYPENTDRDDQFLLRFAQLALREFAALLGHLGQNSAVHKALEPFAEPIAWIRTPVGSVTPRPERLTYAQSRVQAGIVSRHEGVTHGCIVLLRVTDAAAARKSLAALPVTIEGAVAGDVRCNVALTLQGLKALGVPAWHIDMFPQEFIEGMESRAGLLGDVLTNHPNAWQRPTLHGSPEKTEIDLGSVHVCVQYRLKDEQNASHELHPTLRNELARFDDKSGLSILSVEAMRSYRETQGMAGITSEHFGFQDGFSQPQIVDANNPVPASTFWKDAVARGEIFLGYGNDREDGPYPPTRDLLLDDGCFLVVRKIRQRVDVLDAVLKKLVPQSDGASNERTELKERMMGRRLDGQPLVSGNIVHGSPNDFNYALDANGAQCPFSSHARRTNPRTGKGIPRIIRRGMSYGPRDDVDLATERGLYFMAYCASIAEQFEVIQRWVAAGNSSGVLSTHNDPFLGVPQPGESRIYRFVDDHNNVVRVDLGDKPFTELQWGVYLFVPSVTALAALDEIAGEIEPRRAPLSPKEQSNRKTAQFEAWQRVLEDPSERDRAWQLVRSKKHMGVLQTSYGLLIADKAALTEVLQDQGGRHSVCGYGRRLAETVGSGYLGLDPDNGHDAQAEQSGVNQAIAAITADVAFRMTVPVASAVIEGFKKSGQPTPSGRTETLVDMAIFSEQVLGMLCKLWFGLPDGKHMELGGRTTATTGMARCPGHFFSVARYVFWPHPSPMVEQDAKAHGTAIRRAVKEFLEAARDETKPDRPKLGDLSRAIESLLRPQEKADDDLVARTIAGVMLGFPPTVHGNFIRVMRAWLQTAANPSPPEPVTSVWKLQAELSAREATRDDYDKVSEVLRRQLLAQMRMSPVPEMIWREEPKAAAARSKTEPPKVVLGLAAAMQDPDADERLMFGGARTAKGACERDPLETVHACPGYEMAIGVLLGMITTLLLAGTLRPTASPTIVSVLN